MTYNHPSLAVLMFASLLPAWRLSAQPSRDSSEPLRLQAGAVVRITHVRDASAKAHLEGTIEAVDSAGLRVRVAQDGGRGEGLISYLRLQAVEPEHGDSLTVQVPWADMDAAEVRYMPDRGGHRYIGTGLAYGFLVGALAGAGTGLIDAAARPKPSSPTCTFCVSVGPELGIVGGVAVGGLVGAITGAVIGGLKIAPEWEAVADSRLRASGPVVHSP